MPTPPRLHCDARPRPSLGAGTVRGWEPLRLSTRPGGRRCLQTCQLLGAPESASSRPPAPGPRPPAPCTHLPSTARGGRATAGAAAGPAPSRGRGTGNSLRTDGQMDVQNLPRRRPSAPAKQPSPGGPGSQRRSGGAEPLRVAPRAGGGGTRAESERTEPVGEGRGREGGRERRAAEGEEGTGLDRRGGERRAEAGLGSSLGRPGWGGGG